MKKVVDLVAFFRFDDVGGSLVERFSWHLELAAVGARYFDAGVCLIKKPALRLTAAPGAGALALASLFVGNGHVPSIGSHKTGF